MTRADAGGRPGPEVRPLRVLCVTTSYPRQAGDFTGHFVHALAREVASLGHAVTVLTPHAAGLAEEETVEGVRVLRFRYAPASFERVAYGDGIPSNVRRDPLALLGAPGFALALRSCVREHAADADVVHVNWAPTAALAGAALAGRPVVLTLHGSDTTLARRGGLWRRLLVSGLRRAARVIAVSREQVAFLRSSELWAGAIDVLPSGVAPDLVDRERPPRDPDEPFTFLYAGRLIESKGVVELVTAFIRLTVTHDVRLRIAGKGPAEGLLRERLVAGGCAGQVEFLGEVVHERALELMTQADAFVLASHGEGSPLSVTEALALGTPVVGTRVGALPELLGDDGLLVDAKDAIALAHAMGRLVDDAALRGRLSREGRERVRARYTWPAVARETVRVYREATGA
ncbi:MAG TPA: glycosyltransferase family 4 protein [Coriobacteriia bacterium]